MRPALRTRIEHMAEELAQTTGVAAVVLGGSHARGRARDDSDVDLGLLYREATPIDLTALRDLARRWNDSGEGAVTKPYEWGPWANGGAWLLTQGQRVDWIYRCIDQVEGVIRAAERGEYEFHWSQQPPFGFFSGTYLGEVSCCAPLQDRGQEVLRLKSRVATYPDALREALVADQLWNVQFGIAAFGRKFAERGDAWGTAACLARFIYQLALALFAWNRVYLVNEKTILEEIAEFRDAPREFGIRAQAILAQPGSTPDELRASVNALAELHQEVVSLCGELYAPRFNLPEGGS